MVTTDRFSVEVVGKGPDIVLIPGLSSSRAVYRATAEALRGRYRLHLVQIAGFAGEPSRANGSGEVLDATYAGLADYLKDLKTEKLVVIGHSLGGALALKLALKAPERIKKGLIIDALPFISTLFYGPFATVEAVKPQADQMRAALDLLPEGQIGALTPNAEATIKAMVTSPENVQMVLDWGRNSDARAATNAMADLMMMDLRPELPGLSVPVTVLYADNFTPAERLAQLDSLWGAGYAKAPKDKIRFQRIDQSKHFIMLDQPKVFQDQVEAFLKD